MQIGNRSIDRVICGLENMMVEEVVCRLKTHEERFQRYGEREGKPSLLLTHAKWHFNLSNPTRDTCDQGRGGHKGRCQG